MFLVFYISGIFICIWEYLLAWRKNIYFHRTLYIYYPLLLTSIVTLGSYFITIIYADLFTKSDTLWLWVYIFGILYLLILTPIIFIYGYIRLFLLKKWYSSRFFFSLIERYSKYLISFIFSICVILWITIKIDYSTHGKYLKLSTQSNVAYLLDEAKEKNNISYCFSKDYSDTDFCQRLFIEQTINKNTIKDISIVYEDFIKINVIKTKTLETKKIVKKISNIF